MNGETSPTELRAPCYFRDVALAAAAGTDMRPPAVSEAGSLRYGNGRAGLDGGAYLWLEQSGERLG